MHIHILGIGGTFMGGVALLARALGHTVTGSDAKVYPPMSTQLESQGITLKEGYDPAHLSPEPDLVIIGNALARGNASVEAVLDQGLRYTSGAQWVAEEVLAGRWVLAVAGTHGTPPTRKPGASCAYSRIHASMLVVVVLPWVPATANTQRPASTSSATHWAPEV